MNLNNHAYTEKGEMFDVLKIISHQFLSKQKTTAHMDHFINHMQGKEKSQL